ncbi:MAG: hypothetical protein M3N19_09565 [Candidatus Eremiobacteraeota bacterium]|nr:hypothetical protein [Candidatus Eremiobacteraeota bacterium]
MTPTSDRGSGLAEHSSKALLTAQQALRAARFDDALAALEGCEDWPAPLNEEAVLLKVDIFVRRDPILSLETLARSSDLFVTPAGRFGYLLASGKAYANSRNYESARAMFRSAEALLAQGDSAWRASLGFQRARLAWMSRDFDPHSADITAALEDTSPGGQVLALSLRAWMHAGREDFTAQIADLSSALRIAMEHPTECDTHAVAIGIHALLRVAFEIGDAKSVALGEAAYEALQWTPDVHVERFQALRVLGWDAFLHGKSAQAQWIFKDSKSIAPSKAWKVMAHADRAYVARMNLNEFWATDELLEAHKIAQEVVWSSTHGEERFVLVTLAILFAPIDMAQAQRYVSKYIQMGTEGIDPTLSATNDRRAIAIERYASGRVQQVLGHKELAIEHLEAAYETFSQTKYHHRASLAAIALSEITGHAEWMQKARTHADRYPHSPISERLHDEELDPVDQRMAALSSMQRQMAVALCEGLEIEELSRRFSRSTFTLSKQIETIYQTLGVTSRNELRELLGREGS